MSSQRVGPILSAVFIDYDNVYISLKKRNPAAARQFAREPGRWIREIERGGLISSDAYRAGTDGAERERRIVLNRSYGSPGSRRGDDKHAFSNVRQNFVRAGCEIVDCPPLTAQLKNSSDIRIVMDVRDLLHHETHFDEFIILSGDSDFTPVLHRLRAHDRRTVVYVNDQTATPYTAIADGEIREADLIAFLEDCLTTDTEDASAHVDAEALSPERADRPTGDDMPSLDRRAQALDDAEARRAAHREAILAEVISVIRAAPEPVAIEMLADRAQRVLGREVTSDAQWAGFGTFRAFLTACLPLEYRLTTESPYLAYEVERMEGPLGRPRPDRTTDAGSNTSVPDGAAELHPAPATTDAADSRQPTELQQTIGRILEACQAPPLSPPEYTVLIAAIAAEIREHGLHGGQTLANIEARAATHGLSLSQTDVRFVLDIISEPDPWFAQGVREDIFAYRFRDFVRARCETQGLQLSDDARRLIDAWFAGAPSPTQSNDLVAPTEPANPWGQEPAPVALKTRPSAPAQASYPADTGPTTSPFALPPLDGSMPQPSSSSQPSQVSQASQIGIDPYAPMETAAPSSSPVQGGSEYPAPPDLASAAGALADMDIGPLPRIVRSRMRN
ncbi:MAG: NYN domain-containing protein [Pseudomonadota bacterium]